MSDRSSSPVTSHEVNVLAQLSILVPPPQQNSTSKKKTSTAKGKIENKNKEFSFTFEHTEVNYLSFLSTILDKHGHNNCTPVVKEKHFGIKVALLGKKIKKDAIDIDCTAEYLELVDKILAEQPTKLTVFVNLEDAVKACNKRVGNADDSSNEGGTEDKGEEVGTHPIDRELRHFRGLLEKKYQNPSDGGYTFVTNDGGKLPLMPAMMSEWARAMYDGKATIFNPPNSQSFDPSSHARSLFQTPKPPAAGEASSMLQAFASIIHDTRAIFSGDPSKFPVTPSNTHLPQDSSISPAKPSPSKLSAFLEYAQEHLGVKNAMEHQYSLEAKVYGPDVLQHVNDKDIIACGVTHGDAIRLKRGAEQWWCSPEAKRPCAGPAPVQPASPEVWHFIKVYLEGGKDSVFGMGLQEGDNKHWKEYDWYYYNQVEWKEQKVPDGMVPVLLDEYLSDPDIPFELSQ